MPTNISWARNPDGTKGETWNPVTGCTPVSEGCAHCYAKKMAHRFGGDFSKVTLHPDRLEIPLHWRKPRMVFVPSMGDLWHEDVPDAFIDRVFAVMALTSRHTYQVLTKRPERMQQYMAGGPLPRWVTIEGQAHNLYEGLHGADPSAWLSVKLPLPNVMLGVSVENQKAADERIPLLLETPAAVRFISAEPLLSGLDLTPWLEDSMPCPKHDGWVPRSRWTTQKSCGICMGESGSADLAPMLVRQVKPGLDWVIVGGESGGPENRRLVERYASYPSGRRQGIPRWRPKPEAETWVRFIRDQCAAAGVAFYFKQWGPRAGQGTLLDGQRWEQYPKL